MIFLLEETFFFVRSAKSGKLIMVSIKLYFTLRCEFVASFTLGKLTVMERYGTNAAQVLTVWLLLGS